MTFNRNTRYTPQPITAHPFRHISIVVESQSSLADLEAKLEGESQSQRSVRLGIVSAVGLGLHQSRATKNQGPASEPEPLAVKPYATSDLIAQPESPRGCVTAGARLAPARGSGARGAGRIRAGAGGGEVRAGEGRGVRRRGGARRWGASRGRRAGFRAPELRSQLRVEGKQKTPTLPPVLSVHFSSCTSVDSTKVTIYHLISQAGWNRCNLSIYLPLCSLYPLCCFLGHQRSCMPEDVLQYPFILSD